MATNSVSALNTDVANNTAANSAANASVAQTTANASATNNSVTAAADSADWVAEYCAGYGQTLLWLAIGFLVVALLLGIASSIIALMAARAQRGGGPGPDRVDVLPDPGKLVDALKGLIDALAKAPAWIAIFVGGILLLWMAGSFAGAVCVPADEEENSTSSNNANLNKTTTKRTTTDPTRPNTGTVSGNTQLPAGNTQGTVTNAQSRPGD